MAQRKELLKAHAFTQQRLVAALVDREPDDPTPPLRRLGLGTFVSILVAVLVLAVFALYGYLNHPSTAAWQQEKTVIVDTDSGVVFFTLDGTTIYPAPNIASARLITGGGTIVKVSTTSLAAAPRGEARGIAEAPSQLPAPKDMTVFPLRVCSLPTSAADSRYTVLDLNAPSPGTDTAIGLEVNGRTYVVVGGVAHLIPDGSPLLGTAVALTGTEAFLRSLPQGQAITPYSGPARNNKAQSGQNLVGAVVYTGDQTDKSSWNYFIQLPDGYSAISYLDAMVNTQTPTAVDPAYVAQHRSATQNSATPGLPMGQVTFATTDTSRTSVCATYVAGSDAPTVTVGDSVDGPADKRAVPVVSSYDRVTTLPGGGALFRSLGTDPDGATFLVWQGRKYGIPDLTSRTSLGYGSGVDIGTVQPSVLSLIPDGMPPGVSLDITHANRPV